MVVDAFAIVQIFCKKDKELIYKILIEIIVEFIAYGEMHDLLVLNRQASLM